MAGHLATSAVVSRGRHATYGTGLTLVARLVPRDAAALLRGRRGAWRHPPSFHVAGVALGDIYLRFVWQACRLALVLRLVPRDAAPLRVAGLALGDIYFLSRGRRGTF